MKAYIILRQGAAMGLVRAPRIHDATRLGRILYGRESSAVAAWPTLWLAGLADARDRAADLAENATLSAFEAARARRRATP